MALPLPAQLATYRAAAVVRRANMDQIARRIHDDLKAYRSTLTSADASSDTQPSQPSVPKPWGSTKRHP